MGSSHWLHGLVALIAFFVVLVGWLRCSVVFVVSVALVIYIGCVGWLHGLVALIVLVGLIGFWYGLIVLVAFSAALVAWVDCIGCIFVALIGCVVRFYWLC